MEDDELRLFRRVSSMGTIPLGDVRLSVLDNDEKGERGGTEHMVEQRFAWRISEGKDKYIERALSAYNIIVGNLVNNHG